MTQAPPCRPAAAHVNMPTPRLHLHICCTRSHSHPCPRRPRRPHLSLPQMSTHSPANDPTRMEIMIPLHSLNYLYASSSHPDPGAGAGTKIQQIQQQAVRQGFEGATVGAHGLLANILPAAAVPTTDSGACATTTTTSTTTATTATDDPGLQHASLEWTSIGPRCLHGARGRARGRRCRCGCAWG